MSRGASLGSALAVAYICSKTGKLFDKPKATEEYVDQSIADLMMREQGEEYLLNLALRLREVQDTDTERIRMRLAELKAEEAAKRRAEEPSPAKKACLSTASLLLLVIAIFTAVVALYATLAMVDEPVSYRHSNGYNKGISGVY